MKTFFDHLFLDYSTSTPTSVHFKSIFRYLFFFFRVTEYPCQTSGWTSAVLPQFPGSAPHQLLHLSAMVQQKCLSWTTWWALASWALSESSWLSWWQCFTKEFISRAGSVCRPQCHWGILWWAVFWGNSLLMLTSSSRTFLWWMREDAKFPWKQGGRQCGKFKQWSHNPEQKTMLAS